MFTVFVVSGSASLISTPSFPTSQELAEIFGNSDDEDDDFPFPPLSGGLAAVGGASSAMAPSLGGPQQGQGSESLLSSLMGPETKDPTLHDGVSEHLPVPSAIQTPPSEENRTSTTSSDNSKSISSASSLTVLTFTVGFLTPYLVLFNPIPIVF